MRNQIISALGWQGGSGAVQALAQFVVLAVLSRLLEPDAFGLIALANSFIFFGGAIIQGSIRPSIIREENLSGEHVFACLVLNILFSALFSLVLLTISASIAGFFDLEELKNVVTAVSIIFFISSFSTVAESLLEKHMNFDKLFYINTGSFIFIYVPIAIGMAYNGYGVWSLVFATMMQVLIKAVLLNFNVNYNAKFTKTIGIYKRIFIFSAVINFAWIATLLAMNVDKWVLGKYFDATVLGFYSLAFMAMDMPRRFFSAAVEKVFFPVFSQLGKKSDRTIQMYSIASVGSIFVLMPVSVFSVINAHNIIGVIFGDKWYAAIVPFQLMMIQIPFRSIIRLTDNLITAVGSVYRLAKIKYIYLFCLVVMCLIAVDYGLVGITTAVLLAVILNYFLSLYIVNKELGISILNMLLFFRDGSILSVPLVLVNFLIVHVFLKNQPLIGLVTATITSVFIVIIVLHSYKSVLSESTQVQIEKLADSFRSKWN